MTALRSGTDVFRSTTKVIFDGRRSNVGWLTSHDHATLQKAGPPTVLSLLSQHGGCSGSSHACVPQAYPDHWTNGSLGQGFLGRRGEREWRTSPSALDYLVPHGEGFQGPSEFNYRSQEVQTIESGTRIPIPSVQNRYVTA
ncbi:hypothetical protein AB5N19_00483 [Seiridium cardinale]|uniref:Uncharacterized protein n=1 Tax=Seiridium cardinale TaxID=138064 RepID=A0ABR2XX10_9PEZI